ncbi:autotransporter domain-containing protein [Synechococcus sp. AH-601-P06]|nr:autotransporter domain-containing protein [Synechococcus sp. AH-601-P06]
MNSGDFALSGDLTFADSIDSADQRIGQLLVNTSTGSMAVDGRITFGETSDVVLNRGELTLAYEAATGDDVALVDRVALQLAGGNDVVLTEGYLDVLNTTTTIDGGEPLNLAGRKGLNVFSYRGDISDPTGSGVQESQLINFAAVQLPDVDLNFSGPSAPDLTGRPEWQFPLGGECRVTDDGRTFSEDQDCVGVVGERKVDQSVTITKGAKLTAGVVALGYESGNSLNLKWGSLKAGLVDGSALGSEQINLGSARSRASGSLSIGALQGVDALNQRGGIWSYDIRVGATPLTASGVVRIPKTAATVFSSITGRADEPLLVNNQGILDVRAPFQQGAASSALHGMVTNASVINQGQLRLSAGLQGERSRLINLAGISELAGQSRYDGITWIRGGTVEARNQQALSRTSRTIVGRTGTLDLGGEVQVVDQVFTAPNVDLPLAGVAREQVDAGRLNNGSLITRSLRNGGVTELDHLAILRGGPDRDFDVDLGDLSVSVEGAGGSVWQRKDRGRLISRQIGLTNSGDLNVSGRIVFQSPDGNGEAQLLRNRYGASLTAGAIRMGDGDDIVVNRGVLSLGGVDNPGDDGVSGLAALQLSGGNDLILDRGRIALPLDRFIDGGENYNNDLENPDGLNIYRYANRSRKKNADADLELSRLTLSQLKNFAAVNLGDGWIFPQGNDCRVDSTGREISNDQLCVGVIGLAGEEGTEKQLTVTDGALLRAGVIALDATANRKNRVELNNTIRLDNGAELNALLIEGADVNLSRQRNDAGVEVIVESLGNAPDSIELGAGGGALKASAIEGVDRIVQEGGTWELHIPYSSALTLEGKGDVVLEATTEFFGESEPGQLQLDRIEGSGLSISSAGDFTVDSGIGGDVDLTITDGITAIGGESDYSGPTLVAGGQLLALNSGALSPQSPMTVETSGELLIDTTEQRIPALEGDGVVSLAGATLDIGSDAADAADEFTFEGTMVGGGALVKSGAARMIVTGESLDLGSLTVTGGQLDIRRDFALDGSIDVGVVGGELDLQGFDQRVGNITLAPGGLLKVGELFDPESADHRKVGSVSVEGLTFSGGQLEVDIEQNLGRESTKPYLDFMPGGSGLRVDEASYDADGIAMVLDVVDFEPEDGLEFTIFGGDFDEAELKKLAKRTALIRETDGGLVTIGTFGGLNESLDVPLYDVQLIPGSLKLSVKAADLADQLDGRDPSDLPGCENQGDLCDATLGDVDALPVLPIITWGELARVVGSGLAPRNVDAAGRGLALHNNLLVDVVFDRQPLRLFDQLVAEQASPQIPDVASDEAEVLPTEAPLNEVEVIASAETTTPNPDGVSAWMKGFGGNSRADDSGVLYNDYDLSAYGTSFGVDVALSESFQIGAFANYGDVNLQHRSGDTGGGSWNPEGWGGGLTAQYSTRNFYVQGLVGASEFTGEQTRNILEITSELGGNTAKGEKKVTSYLGALRVGAPFKTGGVVLEPQAQMVWTQNQEQGFSESRGTEKNLRLKYNDRTTNFLETELGMKLSVPIRTGERSLLVPSVRAAWLADWNQNNEAQRIGYKFTNQTVDFDSQLETQNGALIEAGLDYTIQNFNRTSVKVYARGGAEVWGGDRGTTWRGSGGVTFQF